MAMAMAKAMETERTHHRELFAEDMEAQAGQQIQQPMAPADMAVDMEGQHALRLVPLRQHLVALEPVVPSLELQAQPRNPSLFSVVFLFYCLQVWT
jgi:hypothetical protein